MSTYEITFSPTGGTKKIADRIAKNFDNDIKQIDLTDSEADFSQLALKEGDLCIIAVPSYGGRVPVPAASRLKKLCGNGAVAVLTAVYGNRDYDDTLLELKDILSERGFRCTGAIAAVAEHSIMHQFASGRPDAEDLKELDIFAKVIKKKIITGEIPKHLNVPGQEPYRIYDGVPMKPKKGRKCRGCGLCAASCPVQAIAAENSFETDKDQCISCMRCLAICPAHARSVGKLLMTVGAAAMKSACKGRKRNEIFIEEA